MRLHAGYLPCACILSAGTSGNGKAVVFFARRPGPESPVRGLRCVHCGFCCMLHCCADHEEDPAFEPAYMKKGLKPIGFKPFLSFTADNLREPREFRPLFPLVAGTCILNNFV